MLSAGISRRYIKQQLMMVLSHCCHSEALCTVLSIFSATMSCFIAQIVNFETPFKDAVVFLETLILLLSVWTLFAIYYHCKFQLKIHCSLRAFPPGPIFGRPGLTWLMIERLSFQSECRFFSLLSNKHDILNQHGQRMNSIYLITLKFTAGIHYSVSTECTISGKWCWCLDADVQVEQ